MSKIYLFDGIYGGHHISYSKNLKMNTNSTMLIVHKSRLNQFSDFSESSLLVLKCKDPQSYKFAIIGWLVNLFYLLINKEIRSGKIHFIYADSIIHYIYLFTLFSKQQFYLTIHWASSVVPLDKNQRSIVKNIYRNIKEYLFSIVGRKASRIFVHGSFTKSKIEKEYKHIEIVEIPYGIEEKVDRINLLNKKIPLSSTPTILFFGGIRYDKGIEQLSELARKCPEYKFIVAGKPESYSKEKIELFFRGLINVILLLEFIPEGEIEDLFLNANILILPYRRHFSGQSGPLTISTVYRIPVVGTLVGDMGQDIIEYNLGITVPENNSDLLKEAVDNLLMILKDDEDFYNGFQDTYYQRGLWKTVGEKINMGYIGERIPSIRVSAAN